MANFQIFLYNGSILFDAFSTWTGREYLATKDLSGISKIQSVSKERELLIQISNGLLRALMADLRSLLGLSPPAGFMSLPLDLADKILGYLPVCAHTQAASIAAMDLKLFPREYVPL